MTEPSSPSGPKPAVPNKRRSRRHAPRGTTRLRVYRTTLGLGPNIAARLLDLSETGARVALKEAVTPGQEMEINLESAAGVKVLKFPGTAVWVVPAADGTFIVGIQFQKSIGFSDLQAMSRT